MKHWAAKHVGSDYKAVGRCWGMIRIACRERLGEDMPAVGVGSDEDQAAAIRRAVAGLGWRRIDEKKPRPDDVVVMEGPEGRHVAWAVEADGGIGVLHAMNEEVGVVSDLWRELPGMGFHSFEIWRRSP